MNLKIKDNKSHKKNRNFIIWKKNNINRNFLSSIWCYERDNAINQLKCSQHDMAWYKWLVLTDHCKSTRLPCRLLNALGSLILRWLITFITEKFTFFWVFPSLKGLPLSPCGNRSSFHARKRERAVESVETCKGSQQKLTSDYNLRLQNICNNWLEGLSMRSTPEFWSAISADSIWFVRC